jgi:hypothetical protein
MPTECSAEQFDFGTVEGRAVEAAFDAGFGDVGCGGLALASRGAWGVATIRRTKVVDGEIPVTSANEAAIRRAFEGAGIKFIEQNGGGEGVRFRKSQAFKKRK